MVLRLGLRNRVWLIWEAGAVALVAMVVFSRVTTTSDPTAWPWITFAAMAICEEALVPTAGDASHRHRVGLVATVTMFRERPDVIALVTLAAGLAGAVSLSRLMTTLLFDVSPVDPMTYSVVVVGLLAVAAGASYLPARRITRVDPLGALRAG